MSGSNRGQPPLPSQCLYLVSKSKAPFGSEAQWQNHLSDGQLGPAVRGHGVGTRVRVRFYRVVVQVEAHAHHHEAEDVLVANKGRIREIEDELVGILWESHSAGIRGIRVEGETDLDVGLRERVRLLALLEFIDLTEAFCRAC